MSCSLKLTTIKINTHKEEHLHIQIAEHIKLAPLVESDAADILKTVNLSRASLGKFLPWVEGVNNIESAKKYILDRVNSGLNGSRWFKIYYKDNLKNPKGSNLDFIHQNYCLPTYPSIMLSLNQIFNN